MSVPAMPARLESRAEAVEAVRAQVDHAQDAARRSDRHLAAGNAAERIVERLDQPARLVREYVARMTGEDLDGDVALVEYVRRLVELPVIAPADPLELRLGRLIDSLTGSDAAYLHLTRGRALDVLEATHLRAAAYIAHPDLDECNPRDQAETFVAVRAARLAAGVVDPPGVGEYARTVEQLNALPDGSVVRDADRWVCERVHNIGWSGRGHVCTPRLPARVLEVGGEQ